MIKMQTKRCPKCSMELPLHDFNKNKSTADGLSSYCRNCKSEAAKRSYRENAESRERVLSRTKDRKILAMDYVYTYLLTHPCVDCGESRIACLEFDHQRDKQRQISNMVSGGFNPAAIQLEIDKCEVVCANCHHVRTAKSQGWYRCIEKNQ